MFRNCTLLFIVTLSTAIATHRAHGAGNGELNGRVRMVLEDTGDHRYFLGSGEGTATYLGRIRTIGMAECWFNTNGSVFVSIWLEAAAGSVFHLDYAFLPESGGWCNLDQYSYYGAHIGQRVCPGTLVDAGDGTWLLEFHSPTTE